MQHLVVLQVMEQRTRRRFRIGRQENGRTRHADRLRIVGELDFLACLR
jgi:hypothetical protein